MITPPLSFIQQKLFQRAIKIEYLKQTLEQKQKFNLEYLKVMNHCLTEASSASVNSVGKRFDLEIQFKGDFINLQIRLIIKLNQLLSNLFNSFCMLKSFFSLNRRNVLYKTEIDL